MSNNKERRQVQIRASDAELKGAYSNVVRITHSSEEFFLDFLNVVDIQGMLVSRIIVSPGHLKRIINAFNENMRLYEKKFGQVASTDRPQETFGFSTG